MANFKVGDKARIARPELPEHRTIYTVDGFVGCTVTVERGPAWPGMLFVYVDGRPNGSPDHGWNVYPYQLEPLVDPKADAFIESIKRLGREPALCN